MCVAVKKERKKERKLGCVCFSLHMVGEALFLCQVRNQTCLFFDAFVVFTVFTVTNLLSGNRQVDVFEYEKMIFFNFFLLI